MIKPKGIAFKTFAFTSLMITAILCVSFAILYFVLPDYYQYTKHNTLGRNAEALAQALGSAADEAACAALIAEFSLQNNADVFSLDRDGALLPLLSTPFVMMDGEGAPMLSLTPGMTQSIAIITQRDDAQSGREDMQFFVNFGETSGVVKFARKSDAAMSVAKEVQSGVIGSMVINTTLQPIDEAKDVMLSLIPFLLALGVAIALMCAYLYAKRLTRPIVQISDAAAQMRAMEPDALSNVRTNDELGHLSLTLDSMYAGLRGSIESLQLEIEKVHALEQSKTDFMRAAGHELKTPIAALNGILEGMIDNVGAYKDKETYLHKCKTLVENLASRVGEILSASRAEMPMAQRQEEDIALRPLIDGILSDNGPMIAEKLLRVDVEGEPAPLRSDRGMLSQALGNILSNAVMYSPSEGSVRIAFAQEGDYAVLSVENACDPIPEEELPRLFEPFYTRDFSRDRALSGTGLGLYIAKRNLDALGIGCELCAVPDGLLVRLSWRE